MSSCATGSEGVQMKLTELLSHMQEFERSGYEAYTVLELQQLLTRIGFTIGIDMLQDMVAIMVAKEHVQRTVSGYIQLACPAAR